MRDLADSLGLYVHWPYCARICPYCDFNVFRPKGDDEALFAAILDDMTHWCERTGSRKLVSLHLGGGTPSLMSAQQIERLIAHAQELWGFEDGAEIGLEANPKDKDSFADFASAGINRLSVGVQSFDDDALTLLGRDHDAALGARSIEAAMKAVDRVSIDLIYALAGQSLMSWRKELKHGLSFGAGHLSPYQLTIEARTAFGKRAGRGEVLTSSEDMAADFFDLTQEVCAEAGLPAYEISNHARSEADQSRHNRLYWEGGDWIGVGPGAHGRVGRASISGRQALSTQLRPKDYIEAVAKTGSGLEEIEKLSVEDELAERILMGMRLSSGLDRHTLRQATGLDVDPVALKRLDDEGYLQPSSDRISLTARGRLFADRLSGDLVPD